MTVRSILGLCGRLITGQLDGKEWLKVESFGDFSGTRILLPTGQKMRLISIVKWVVYLLRSFGAKQEFLGQK
jgi:hypothetical protein